MFIRGVVYPLMETFKGNKIRTYLKELKETETLDRTQIIEFQKEKLRKLLLHCIKNVHAYKQFEYLESLINTDPLKALEAFPVLTKRDFSSHREQYISSIANKESLIPYNTGGSTGAPVKFYVDRATLEYYSAARLKGLSWWGIEIGAPCIMVWGSPIELNQYQNKVYRLKERFLKNSILISAYDLQPNKMKEIMKQVDSFRPAYFYGYATALTTFALLMKKQNLSFKSSFKGVVSTAETLSQEQRTIIEEAFKAPVINEYGAKDAGIIAYQHPDGNMYVMEDTLVLEVFDVQHNTVKLEDGNAGLATVTDLNNFAMPRIRYQLGDVITVSKEINPKNTLKFKTLDNIEGREDDIFVSQSGKLIHGHYWAHIVRSMNGIEQFQIIQHDMEHVTLKIVPKASSLDQKEIDKLLNKIQEALGKVNVDLQVTDKIEPASSGKIRYAIREFPLGL